MSPKYAPLAAFLAAQSSETSTVTLTLVDVEETIGTALPPSARSRRWWVNCEELKHALFWLDAGWVVTARALRTPTPMITFARMGQTQPARSRLPAPTPANGRAVTRC
jgi:hypothetical protein